MRTAVMLLMVIIAGCSTAPIQLDTQRNEVRIEASDVVDVALSDADRSRKDFMKTALRTINRPIDSGAIWSKAFIGGPGAPVYSVKSSELRWVVTAAGFAARMDYTSEGELIVDGTSYPIKASGSQSFVVDGTAAIYDAIAGAVLDAARQCREIVTKLK